MLINTPTDLMILKLSNSEDFKFSESYWHDDRFYQFEGMLADVDQVQGYGGEQYGEDYFFQVHTVYATGDEYDYHQSDIDICESHPWIAIISGDHTMLCVFKRFASYAELCSWLDTPDYSDLFYVY